MDVRNDTISNLYGMRLNIQFICDDKCTRSKKIEMTYLHPYTSISNIMSKFNLSTDDIVRTRITVYYICDGFEERIRFNLTTDKDCLIRDLKLLNELDKKVSDIIYNWYNYASNCISLDIYVRQINTSIEVT